jgi:hypothetical protein
VAKPPPPLWTLCPSRLVTALRLSRSPVCLVRLVLCSSISPSAPLCPLRAACCQPWTLLLARQRELDQRQPRPTVTGGGDRRAAATPWAGPARTPERGEDLEYSTVLQAPARPAAQELAALHHPSRSFPSRPTPLPLLRRLLFSRDPKWCVAATLGRSSCSGPLTGFVHVALLGAPCSSPPLAGFRCRIRPRQRQLQGAHLSFLCVT